MKKRFLAVALTVAMGASLLAGCGSKAEETTAAAAEAATEAAKEEAAETEAAEEKAEAAGTHYMLVEQDDCNGEDPFDCLARSYKNLKALGLC